MQTKDWLFYIKQNSLKVTLKGQVSSKQEEILRDENANLKVQVEEFKNLRNFAELIIPFEFVNLNIVV